MSFLITGTGSDLPTRTISNDDIAHASRDYDAARTGVDLEEWVSARSGVRSRHRVATGEGPSDMAVRAARRALDSAGTAVDEVDLIVLGTFTSDMRLPSTVSLVAQALGSRAKCLQLETACTGFVDALLVATSVMGSGGYRTALVIDTEAMSAVVDEERFMYQTVFGDGAGAVVVRHVAGAVGGIEVLRTYTDANSCHWTWAPGGGSKYPVTSAVLAERSQYLSLEYREIFRFAVEKMVDITYEVLNCSGQTVDDVDWLVPHQAGLNIMGAVAERLKLPAERVVSCVEHTGNVSGAGAMIALDEARRAGLLQPGQRVVIPVVGSGMAWGAASVTWAQPAAA